MTEKTVRCHICGQPYVFYAFYAGDQSACPDCQQKARGPHITTTGTSSDEIVWIEADRHTCPMCEGTGTIRIRDES